MKNQTILLAERVVRPIDKNLYDSIAHALNVHFDPEGSVNVAITGLLDLIANRKHKHRLRTFRDAWVDVMFAMASEQRKSGRNAVHRSKFVTADNNDFDKLKHWGFIKSLGCGEWTLTRYGAWVMYYNITFHARVSYRGDGCDAWHFSKNDGVATRSMYKTLDDESVKDLRYVISNGVDAEPCIMMTEGGISIVDSFRRFKYFNETNKA